MTDMTPYKSYSVFGPPANTPEAVRPVQFALQDMIKTLQKFERDSDELGSIQATLRVNLQEGRALHKAGCAPWDENASTHTNMVVILEHLIKKLGLVE